MQNPKDKNYQAVTKIHLNLLLCFIPWIVWSWFPNLGSATLIESLKVINCLLFIWTFGSTLYLGKNLSHPYVLFLVALFTFVTSRIFFDLFSSDIDLSGHEMMNVHIAFSQHTQVKLQILILIATWFGHLGALLAFNKTKTLLNQELRYDLKWGKTGLILFWVFLIPTFLYITLQVQYFYENGYREFLKPKESLFTSSSVIFRLSDDFFRLGFFLFLASKPSRRQLLAPLFIFISLLLYQSILGARTAVFTQTLAIVSYLGYRQFIKNKHVLIAGMCLILLSAMVNLYRWYSYYDKSEYFSVSTAITDSPVNTFFTSQSTTCGVIGMTLEMENQAKVEKSITPLFYPLISPVLAKIHTIMGKSSLEILEVNKRNYLANIISTAILGKEKTSEGAGLGSSYIIEFYFALGIIGLALGCLLLFYYYIQWIEQGFVHTLSCFFLLYTLPAFFFMPRANPAELFSSFFAPAILLLLVVCVVKTSSYLPNRRFIITKKTN